MVSMSEITSSEQGRIFISIIWGLGLSALFRKVCTGRNCIVIKGPKPSEMHNKIFKFDGQCFKYTAETTSCKAKTKLQ